MFFKIAKKKIKTYFIRKLQENINVFTMSEGGKMVKQYKAHEV